MAHLSVICILLVTSLSWASEQAATNSPPHVLHMGMPQPVACIMAIMGCQTSTQSPMWLADLKNEPSCSGDILPNFLTSCSNGFSQISPNQTSTHFFLYWDCHVRDTQILGYCPVFGLMRSSHVQHMSITYPTESIHCQMLAPDFKVYVH